MAMFPFFIVLTSLAGLFGSQDLADEVAQFLLATWPEEVAGRSSGKSTTCLEPRSHTGVLTLGLVLAVYFASSGIESLRIGLNRAYGEAETRHWFCCGSNRSATCCWPRSRMLALGHPDRARPAPVPHRAALRAVARAARRHLHVLALRSRHRGAGRSRWWSPTNGCRPAAARWIEILPGIVATLVLWLVTGIAFGRYLAQYSATPT